MNDSALQRHPKRVWYGTGCPTTAGGNNGSETGPTESSDQPRWAPLKCRTAFELCQIHFVLMKR